MTYISVYGIVNPNINYLDLLTASLKFENSSDNTSCPINSPIPMKHKKTKKMKKILFITAALIFVTCSIMLFSEKEYSEDSSASIVRLTIEEHNEWASGYEYEGEWYYPFDKYEILIPTNGSGKPHVEEVNWIVQSDQIDKIEEADGYKYITTRFEYHITGNNFDGSSIDSVLTHYHIYSHKME